MLSIITSSFREEWCKRLIDSIQNSITKMPYEIIVVGPNKFDYKGVVSIQDFGSPTRCVQIGSIAAQYKYLCWISDDCLIIENNLEKSIDLLEHFDNKYAQLVLPYFEGEKFSGNINTHPASYWNIYYHGTLALPGIPTDYKVAFIGMMQTQRFRELGGFDCRFDGINLSCVDLSVRIQSAGAPVIVPDFYVCNADWSYMTDAGNRGPLQAAFDEKDYPLFRSKYSVVGSVQQKIDYNNWMYNTSSVWDRRFAISKK